MTSRSRSPKTSRKSEAEALGDLRSFLDESPTAHHAAASGIARLLDAGFTWFDAGSDLPSFAGSPVKGFFTRGGALIAFVTSGRANDHYRIIGAHTDSPALFLKTTPEGHAFNFGTLEVEVYGSPLLNSWLDRDLDLAGHVVRRNGSLALFRTAAPIARLPQLAIHLDRAVNENGVVLDKHAHLRPVWSTGSTAVTVRELAAALAEVKPDDVVSVHAQLVDHQPASLLGVDGSLLASGRLDNQLSCWAAIDSITKVTNPSGVAVVALFDQEEDGSESPTGAARPFLQHVLEP
ncbi:MAG: M18 family aminopeptidase, partial [Ilumatobacteraceae bacterium]